MIFIKIKVFFPAFLICSILMILSITMFCIMIGFGGLDDLNIVSLLITIIFLLIGPIVLFVWTLFTMANSIIVNEKGIARYRFGKRIKFFQWKEIKTIACTSPNSFIGWCYVSNEVKKYDSRSITRMRLDNNVIYFHISSKAIETLKKYVANIEIILE